jgi:hypothetical protein
MKICLRITSTNSKRAHAQLNNRKRQQGFDLHFKVLSEYVDEYD